MKITPEIEAIVATSIESSKLQIDVIKHITTLATGAVVILASFLEKFKTASHCRICIPISVGLLLLCIVYAGKALLTQMSAQNAIINMKIDMYGITEMADVTAKLVPQVTYLKKLTPALTFSLSVVSFSFAFGIISLGVFVIANLL